MLISFVDSNGLSFGNFWKDAIVCGLGGSWIFACIVGQIDNTDNAGMKIMFHGVKLYVCDKF
jgi:hypothetical protein